MARLRISRGLVPYLLLVPGMAWLFVFYIYPAAQMFLVSLETGNLSTGYQLAFNWGIYRQGFEQYLPWIVRSAEYGGLATLFAFVLGYPLAYTIAFKGGQYKNVLLFLVIAPFFTSFLLRTLSWKIIFADSGILLGPLKAAGILPDDFRLLATPAAVVAGITYNFLPFMTLPLYVALEKVDVRLVDAARDLYAGPYRPQGAIFGGVIGAVLVGAVLAILGVDPVVPAIVGAVVGAVIGHFLISEAFVRVVLPLSLPGIFAGSLLTFIPAVGDFVNAELLGDPSSQMIGNVIQSRFLQITDYPMASALSFILMAAILIGVLVYARLLGTEELTGAAV
ncbi:MAG TPA: ABC transporter permease [Candidatus Limnocylindrales bacterium]